ncbi:MAG: selenocysteine lyase [Acidobacteria bacterium]|nr:selenocysteine lyase [Acidobacteriota bacterium]
MSELERFFNGIRRDIVGVDQTFRSPYGNRRIVYADWTASGRLYAPIERQMLEVFGPFVANTHSESSTTGTTMTHAYQEAHAIIKRHVNAGPDDVIITAGSGMTTVVNKLIRMLGLRLPEQLASFCSVPDHERPVVFVTHMEHHSNQTTWIETIADVEVIAPDARGLVDCDSLAALLERYRDRPLKIGTFTACSNVTGIATPYHQLARIMHEHDGYCFVDFAASAPYVTIDMHPADDPAAKLDAVFFSPHKFLGGPGTPGVLVFDSSLYHNRVPDQPGGGTVNWTNPWKEHSFVDNIEVREDGGTPGFLQAIKAALAIRLKEEMGVDRMLAREHELLPILFAGLRSIPGVHLLADQVEDRLAILSFYVEDMHYNLVVKLLNDRFGVQVRGGCSCAGTYGHYLLHVDPTRSHAITAKIDEGDLSDKPGWVRMSVHPTTTTDEAHALVDAVRAVVTHASTWERDYVYSPKTNEFQHIHAPADGPDIRQCFDLRLDALVSRR